MESYILFLFQLVELTGMYDDIQDRIWEIEKVNIMSLAKRVFVHIWTDFFQSWRNNLIFHGVRYDDPNHEEDPNRTEEKVRTIIRLDLQLSREIPILRAYRSRNGPLVKGTHPILGKEFLSARVERATRAGCAKLYYNLKEGSYYMYFQCLSKTTTTERRC